MFEGRRRDLFDVDRARPDAGQHVARRRARGRAKTRLRHFVDKRGGAVVDGGADFEQRPPFAGQIGECRLRPGQGITRVGEEATAVDQGALNSREAAPAIEIGETAALILDGPTQRRHGGGMFRRRRSRRLKLTLDGSDRFGGLNREILAARAERRDGAAFEIASPRRATLLALRFAALRGQSPGQSASRDRVSRDSSRHVEFDGRVIIYIIKGKMVLITEKQRWAHARD